MTATATKAKLYRVVLPGASYVPSENPKGRRFAEKGAEIELSDEEAQRLTGLGAIVPADQPNPQRKDLTHTYGAVRKVPLEVHAEEVEAEVKAKAAKE